MKRDAGHRRRCRWYKRERAAAYQASPGRIGYPPFGAEEVDATEVGDHRFRLDSVPAFAFGLAKGDVVRVGHYGAEAWIEELAEASEHSTVRVIALGPNDVDVPRRAVEALGCSVIETVIDRMIAVDVPPTVDFDSVRTYLAAGQRASKWDFNVGVRADGRPL
jgi:hypothetical protein